MHQDIHAIMAARRSVRTYSPGRPSPEDIATIRGLVAAEAQDHEGRAVRMDLVESATGTQPRQLGTYGMIQGATYFLIGAFDRGNPEIERYGYAFEKVVLALTGAGFGTCWLGGTFDRGFAGKVFPLGDHEFIPCISPVGRAGEVRLKEKIVRGVAGSDRRKPEDELFSGTFTDPLTRAAVRQAPSASNKQPWRIMGDKDGWHLFQVSNPGYSDRLGWDIQRLDMGIAMCHLELSQTTQGRPGAWKTLDPAERPAGPGTYRITWVPAPSPSGR